MSSAGNRGVFSNNGATNWNFNRGGSGAGTTDNTAGGSTAERRRVSVSFTSSLIYTSSVIFHLQSLEGFSSMHKDRVTSYPTTIIPPPKHLHLIPPYPLLSLPSPLLPVASTNSFPSTLFPSPLQQPTDTDPSTQSSGSSAQRFANLHNQKRNSSDMTAAARRASFADQSKAPGFLGGMWQNWTKGSGK